MHILQVQLRVGVHAKKMSYVLYYVRWDIMNDVHMVQILDGSSKHFAHLGRKIGLFSEIIFESASAFALNKCL